MNDPTANISVTYAVMHDGILFEPVYHTLEKAVERCRAFVEDGYEGAKVVRLTTYIEDVT